MLAGGLAALAVLTGVSSVLTVRQSDRAQDERRTAVSRSLATQTVAKLDEDPDVAALLSLEAYRTEPTLEARSAALSVLPRLARELHVLRGHSGPVAALQFRAGGPTLVSGGRDGTVRTWDSQTGRQTGRIPGLQANIAIRAVKFSPDGVMLAASSDAGTFRIRDLRSPSGSAPPLGSYERAISTIAFSPHGDLVAAGTLDGNVRFFDARTERELERRAPVQRGQVLALAFAPDGRTLVSGADDGTLERWDVQARRALVPALTDLDGSVNALAFTASGDLLAVGGSDGRVRLWDPGSWTELGVSFTAGVGVISALAFTPDGTALAVAGETGAVRLWDPRKRSEVAQPLAGHTGAVLDIAFRADGVLASAGVDGTVRLWRPFGDGSTLTGHTGRVLPGQEYHATCA